MIKEAKHFELHELLPPDIYTYLFDNNILWKGWLMFPYTTIETIDAIRKQFGPTYINTYALPKSIQDKFGNRTDSGLRIRDFSKKPGYVSAHHHGLATDSVFQDTTAKNARKFILENPSKFPHIMRLECTIKGKEIGWLHWDSVSVNERIYQLHL